MSLLDDWLKYVNDPSAFDRNHFDSLLSNSDSSIDLELAFGSLPSGGQFIARLQGLEMTVSRHGLYFIPDPPRSIISNGEAEVLAKKYAESVANRLREIGEIPEAQVVSRAPVKMISRNQYQADKAADSLLLLDAPMTLEFDFIDWTQRLPRWIPGMYEAVYALTASPEVTRYMLHPLTLYPLDDEAYYRIWVSGRGVDFCEDVTLLILQ